MSSFDYRKIIKLISPMIKQQTDCTDFVLDNDIGDQPTYPFASYSYLNLHTDVTQGVLDNEIFELGLQITTYSTDYFDTINQSESIRKLLLNYANSLEFDNQNIYVIDVTDSSVTDDPISIQIGHKATFTVHFRVMDDFSDNIPELDSVNFN